MSMYRFRSVHSLLDGYQELEKQEIYFATAAELNDPMEGLREVFWQGDEIVWANLIRNYTKALMHVFLLNLLDPKNSIITEDQIPITRQLLGFSSPRVQELFTLIMEKMNGLSSVRHLPSLLVIRSTPIRRDELIIYLTLLHPIALACVAQACMEKRWVNKSLFDRNPEDLQSMTDFKSTLEQFEKVVKEHGDSTAESMLTRTTVNIQSSLFTPSFLNLKEKPNPNHHFIQWEFPRKYVSSLEGSIYAPLYLASFVKECNNTAVWGNYGDRHRGVCLKFKTGGENPEQVMQLLTEYGYSNGPIIGMRPHTFKEVEYHNKHIEVDFFRSIWQMSKMELNALWYSDEEGNISECADHLSDKQKEDEWGEQNWRKMLDSSNIKLAEWNYEDEYRLVIHSMFQNYSTMESRKLKYDFNDLEGIVFGIKTQVDHKIRIIELIKAKCKKHNRSDFAFYQAYYCRETGKIENLKLNI